MAGEFDEGKDHHDYTKWIWGGIILAVICMLAVVGLSNRPDSSRTQANVKHILVRYDAANPAERQRALETITDLRKRILGGESFEKLAKEYSDDPSTGANGGNLGWAEKGIYEESFENYVWNGPVGEISEIITTSFGFHLILIVDRQYSAADLYDQEVEKKAKERSPNAEVSVPKGIPPAAPAAAPPAQAVPAAESVPPAQAVPPAEPIVAPQSAAPAPVSP